MTVSDQDITAFPVRVPGAPYPPCPYAEFRERPGLVRSELPTGSRVWLVTRHEDVRAVLTDRRISSNPAREGFPSVARTGGVPSQEQIPGWFVGIDPPEHDRFRKALIPEFSVRRIKEWRPLIQETVDRCLDRMLELGGSADLVAEFALPVPSLVISTMLGVPFVDRDFFESRTRTLVDLKASTEDERDLAVRELLRYIGRLIALKQKRPGEDLVSRLLATGVLSPQELTGVIMLLLIAGHETTANNIALGVVTLLSNPRWIGDERVADELLRYHSVADLVSLRVAVEDVEIGGQLIRAGEGIMPLIAGANRDLAAFERPDEFDPSRSARQHVAFGYGVHQCLGQNLVRAEMDIVYRTLFRRVPTLAIDADVDALPFKYDGTIFGLHALPVRW
ncbi:cytochrome P450 [Actinokineospora sp. PR83]|uniref:cytochrome P450 n=1 Tax=Actinokineospora sp. PR83 TaxID=2884908 RepID=UPI001F2FC2AE|nr:cytochrome P450 [Actinokineospora sp. PR83]MCG8915000.1 cytochrome P450 [Actinokineospora sp. PR83]